MTKLVLKGSPFPKVSVQEIAQQIEGLKKAEKKLPTWFYTKNSLFPKKLNLEQTSSEITAKYKANLVKGTCLIDLTGGFGVDSFFFSKNIDEVTYCEKNEELAQLAKHNFQELSNRKNTVFHNKNGLDFLNKSDRVFDWIYIDPSRRSNSGNKVFRLEDCAPNLMDCLPLLMEKSKNILIKTAPLLDLNLGISALKNVCEIHIVAVSNEVKELLWILNSKTGNDQIPIKTINFNKGKTEKFESSLKKEQGLPQQISEPLRFLYEPNSAIMKSGLFNSVSEKFDLPKLHANSHLYTSKKLIDFPGRTFEISKVLPFKPKLLKREFSTKKANIATRNFPQPVDQIKAKLGLKDGGDEYLFFTTDFEERKTVLVCKKIV
ncbi:MAG TPA: class I SAM-dependent methyltransferase [Flavobacteriaceae bacterium]|nr:class I SAM-dependent methyltransferase [Flavobacteriaceae bacterium]